MALGLLPLSESNINNAAPEKPMMIPKILLAYNRSFKKIALRTKTMIGVVTISTDALIGAVRDSPFMNVTILKPTPQKAARAINGNSLKGTRSLGLTIVPIIQNIAAVTSTLYQLNP